MNPLDIDTDWGSKLAHHAPMLGAMVASAKANSTQTVELWQLVVAIIALTVALCTSVYWLARDQEQTRGMINVINAQQIAQDAIIKRIVDRQDINSDKIAKLESQAAVTSDLESRMAREHADIMSMVRAKR